MLTIEVLNQYLQALHRHTNDLSDDIVINIIAEIENEFSQTTKNLTDKKQFKEIEKEFIKPYQLNDNDDTENAQQLNQFGHTVLCYAKMMFLKNFYSGYQVKSNYFSFTLGIAYSALFNLKQIEELVYQLISSQTCLQKTLIMENIKNKYNLMLTTLPSNDSELLTEIEKRFLRYIPTNESHMKPFENEMENTFILTCARIALMKLIVAKSNQAAGMFQDISYDLFYVTILNVFDYQYRDNSGILKHYMQIANKSYGFEKYSIKDLNDVQLIILKDVGIIGNFASILNIKDLFHNSHDVSGTVKPCLNKGQFAERLPSSKVIVRSSHGDDMNKNNNLANNRYV